jgi:Swt1-like HEPN/Protein of unknown function (DUF499)
MATSNRDRVNKMFETAAPAFDAFLQKTLADKLTDGADWTLLVAARDEQKGILGKEYSRADPQVQLRMLTENIPHQLKPGWYPFDGLLSQVHKSYASELRKYRDDFAHNKPFSDDDAYRALDTCERLLVAVGDATAAGEVASIRLNLRRVTADKDDRKHGKDTTASPESQGLKPWREVLQPHEDVATGNFHAAEFAADLYKVATGDPQQSSDYSDPVQFFSRTYLTEGLRDLISRTVRRLGGDTNASPVINLQTNFGGGKTHSMLALWHLAGGQPLTVFNQDVQELLAANGYGDLPDNVHRVAIVGNHLAPTGVRKTDEIYVNTIWGELAWQLGREEAYRIVADADRAGTSPGEALHTLISKYAPAVILIDEWVAYARQLYSLENSNAGTFETQFTFAQLLTEAVKATPGVLLAISIPASDVAGDIDSAQSSGTAEEVGGTYGLAALDRLQNIVGRLADQWRPASSNEAYHIVRRRLFVEPDRDALAAISATARTFVEMYRKQGQEFPREAREVAYELRIKETYPIHPELFDRLYEDWSTLDRFQRTRGVLRLMNTVIHALWVGENDASPLIMPGSIPLAASDVNAELTSYLPDSWKPIIDADVDGDGSEPVRIDTETPLYGQRRTTRRLARTVFFGAAPTIGSAHKGLETQRVFLGTALPGDVVGNFHSALTRLADRATYFYTGQGKYWYDTQANITRRAKDQADRLHPEDVWAEIVDRLQGQRAQPGQFVRVIVCPEDSSEILDVDEAALVIVHPKVAHAKNKDSDAIGFARKSTETRGTSNRANRNMVVYLAADALRLDDLESAVRQHLGWKDVLDHAGELDLTPSQRQQAEEQTKRHSDIVTTRLSGAYQWLLVPTQSDPAAPFTILATKAEGQAPSLAERVSKRLGTEGLLTSQLGPATIRFVLDTRIPAAWESGYVSLGELWRLFARYPYMTRLRDRAVLDEGAVQEQSLAWEHDGFALADGFENGRFRGLSLPTDNRSRTITDNTLVVKPSVAQQQRQQEAIERRVGDEPLDAPSDKGGDSGTKRVGPASPAPPVVETTRFVGSKTLNAERYGVDFKKIADEVLTHLTATPGIELAIRVEIDAHSPDGIPEATIRTVSENADALKFDTAEFE